MRHNFVSNFLFKQEIKNRREEEPVWDLGFAEFQKKHNHDLLVIELLQTRELEYSEENKLWAEEQIGKMIYSGMINGMYEKLPTHEWKRDENDFTSFKIN